MHPFELLRLSRSTAYNRKKKDLKAESSFGGFEKRAFQIARSFKLHN
jgi:hypothetical protein